MGSSTAQAPPSAPVRASTVAEAFRMTVARCGDQPAVRTKDDEISLSWSQLRDRVDALAGGLARLGVRRGDTVALMLTNRPEFYVADLAAMTLGATPFSIYATSSPEQIAYVVSDARAKVAFVEESLLELFRAARSEVPELEHLIVLEVERGSGTIAWSDELTPTMKLKRRPVGEKYADQIEAMYSS